MMQKCKHCGATALRSDVLPEFHDDHMGVPIILMSAVTQESCEGCGTVSRIVIPALPSLITAVAVKRITVADKLNGDEVRFLRKALGWKAKELAEKLQVTPESISRWENGAQLINSSAEQYLRLVVCSLLAGEAPGIRCDPNDIVNLKVRVVRAAAPPETLRFWYVKRVAANGGSDLDGNYQEDRAA
jgi:DNA-binding transcriptional regulator YiaG